jgi:co-chaperonin GroES (HSP10)
MKNSSGYTPCEFNVLILPDPVEEKTTGGLILASDTLERNKHAATKGTIVASAPLAFNEDIWPMDMPRPEPGQRCLISRHAGVFIDGEDRVEYRIVKDKDVVALIG